MKDFIHKSSCTTVEYRIVTLAKSSYAKSLSHTRKNISRQGVNCLPWRKVTKPGAWLPPRILYGRSTPLE